MTEERAQGDTLPITDLSQQNNANRREMSLACGGGQDPEAICMKVLYVRLVEAGNGNFKTLNGFCRRCGEIKIFPQTP